MSDPQFSEQPDPIRAQPTILVPAPQDDLLGIIARNTGPLAWVAMLFVGFGHCLGTESGEEGTEEPREAHLDTREGSGETFHNAEAQGREEMTQKQIRGLWLTSRLRAVPFRMFSWLVTVASAVVSWFMYALHGRLLPLLLSSGLAMVVSVLMVEDYRTFLDVVRQPPPSAPARLVNPETRKQIRAGISQQAA